MSKRNNSIRKALKRTTAGNYFGYYRGYSIFACRRLHGGFYARIMKGNTFIASEGISGSCMPTLRHVQKYAVSTVKTIEENNDKGIKTLYITSFHLPLMTIKNGVSPLKNQ